MALERTMTDDRQPLVICVDDDEAMLNTVVRCLKREQIEIRSTLSASEALGWIAAEDVAVLVSDYDMPEMTGAQLAGHARRVRAGVQRNRELIEMTGDRQRRERREAMRTALEAEYPGISKVTRSPNEAYVVTTDPWGDAADLGLPGLSAKLEDRT
jgi:CheY-like chemotaxis protein